MVNIIWFFLIGLLAVKIVFISFEGFFIGAGIPFLMLGLMFLMFLSVRGLYASVLSVGVFFWVVVFNFILFWSFFVGFLLGTYSVESLGVLNKFVFFQALVLLGMLSVHLGKEKELSFSLFVLAFMHVIGGILGPLFGVGAEEIDGVTRYHGISGKINTLANLALFSAIYYFVQYHEKRLWRFLIIALLAISVIFFTGTLKNILIFSLILPFLVLRGKKIFIYIPALIFLGVGVSFYMSEHLLSVFGRFSQLYETGVSFDISRGEKVGNSFNWRILHWRLLWDDWVGKSPFLGVGLGGYLSLNGLVTTSGVVFDPHNDWLKLLLEFGIFGWLFLVAIVLKIGRFLYKFSAENCDAKALYFAFLGLCLAMFAANVIFSLAFFYFFLPMLGAVFYRSRLEKTTKELFL